MNSNNSWFGTKCCLDGLSLSNVRSVDFHVAVDEVPTFQFETAGLPDIDMPGEAWFRFTPETVREAATILQNEFRNNEDSRKSLIASIASALKELPKESELLDAAESIAGRIFDLEVETHE